MPEIEIITPYTMVFDRLWELAVAHPVVSEVVRPGNMIDFGKRRVNPLKTRVAAADLPELILAPSTSVFNLHDTSSTSRATKQYDWIVTSADMRLSQYVLPLEWALTCAMTRWKEELSALQWQGRSFVKECNMLNGRTGQTDEQRMHGSKGFAVVLTCEVMMVFRTIDMQAEITGQA